MDYFSTAMLMTSNCTYLTDKPCPVSVKSDILRFEEMRVDPSNWAVQLEGSALTKTELLSLYIIDQTQNPITHMPFAKHFSKLVTDPGWRTSFSETHWSPIKDARNILMLSQTGAPPWTTNYHCSSPLLRFLAGVSGHSRLPVIFWIHHHWTCTTCLLLSGR